MINRVLCIVSNLNQGGAETFLMKLYRNMEPEQYQMDFCIMSEIKGKYEQEVLSRGGRIFRVVSKSKNPMKCFLQIRKTVKENGYQSVVRVNEHSLSVIDLLAAKMGGAKKLVMRSSNANSTSRLSKFLHKLFQILPKTIPDIKIAPSDLAAEYTFGKKQVKSGKVHFLRNGIQIEQYLYQPQKREQLRKEMNLENQFVIGHVGRFSLQKNHKFLIEIFAQIAKRRPDVKLLLIGQNGNLEEQTRQQVKALALEDKVVFLGNRSDVPDLMSAVDVLLFPSFYEGMPNVVIEAQASGLPCVISDTITQEADITGLVEYLPLSQTDAFWAESVLKYANNFNRNGRKEDFVRAGYDIADVTRQFIDLVF